MGIFSLNIIGDILGKIIVIINVGYIMLQKHLILPLSLIRVYVVVVVF